MCHAPGSSGTQKLCSSKPRHPHDSVHPPWCRNFSDQVQPDFPPAAHSPSQCSVQIGRRPLSQGPWEDEETPASPEGPLGVAPHLDAWRLGLRVDPPPKGVPWFLRASSSGSEVGLPEALPLTPPPPPRRPSHSPETRPRLPARSSVPGVEKGLEARPAAGSAGGGENMSHLGGCHPPACGEPCSPEGARRKLLP